MTAALAGVGSLTVIRDLVGEVPSGAPEGGPQMTLLTESGSVALAVDVAPRDIEYGGMNHNWAEAERSGTVPLLLHESIPLLTMSFSFMMTSKTDLHEPITARVDRLRELARHHERVLCRYGPSEQGVWRITACSMSSELRAPGTNAITRATVSITLTQASDAAPAIGPVLRPPPPPPPPPKPPPPRTHTVRKGDTLWDIARRYYGPNAGPSWPRIFDANRSKIKDPHWIYPGQNFVIP